MFEHYNVDDDQLVEITERAKSVMRWVGSPPDKVSREDLMVLVRLLAAGLLEFRFRLAMKAERDADR